jgi:hypothetical protein
MDHGRLIAQGTLTELCGELPEEEPALLPCDAPYSRGFRDGCKANLEHVFLGLTGRSLRE